jgi:hypothetical protein
MDMDTRHETAHTGQEAGIATRSVKDRAGGRQSGSARTTAKGGRAPEDLPGAARNRKKPGDFAYFVSCRLRAFAAKGDARTLPG